MKARGFSRPPGSPRLITRLRRIRELQINRAGTDHARGFCIGAAPTAASLSGLGARADGHHARAVRRRTDACGSGFGARTYEERRAEVEAALRGERVPSYSAPATISSEPASGESDGDEPDSSEPDGNVAPTESAAPTDAPRRRRSRRGGRRRRRHSAPAAG